jgi:hypothetical protein
MRHVEVGENIGKRADVILVAMRDDNRPHLVAVLAEVGDVGDHQIDAQHLFFGEHKAAIDNHNVVRQFERHHVFANFAQAAERNNS